MPLKSSSIFLGVHCTFGVLLAISGQAETLPDPTRPALMPDTVAGTREPGIVKNDTLSLQSTLISPGKRSAIINGRTVVEGDAVGDAKVSEIQSDAVTLVRGEEQKTIKLLPSFQRDWIATHKRQP